MAYIQKGNRGGIVSVYDGFRYHNNRAGKERISWRCWRKTCRTRLQTNVFNSTEENPQIVITHAPQNHGHPQDNEMITASTLANEMEQEVRHDKNR